MSETIVVRASKDQPVTFTQEELGWLPWLDPLPEAEFTERHWAGLVERSRAKSDYFRLLVRDPQILEARTKTDKDIFYNIADGLPRAERELAARQPPATMDASIVRPCMPVSLPSTPSAAMTFSACSTKAWAPISGSAGTRLSAPRSRLPRRPAPLAKSILNNCAAWVSMTAKSST